MTDLIFLGKNDVGESIYSWLVQRTDVTVIAMLTEKEQLSLVHDVEPDLIVSAGFRYLVPPEVLEIPRLGAVNLHLSYLPHNRGMNPNVWSLLTNTPAGVSIHYMTEEFDNGEIIDRQKVPTHPDDTGKDLYDRLVDTQVNQFKRVWEDIKSGSPDTIPQSDEEGSYHSKDEFVDLWEIDLDESLKAGDFIDRLRALTFPPFNNAYFEVDDERYYVEIEIIPERELKSDSDTGNIPSYNEK